MKVTERKRLGVPDLGVGVGLRIPHYRAILDTSPEVDWFEIISENFMIDGGKPLYFLEEFRARYRIVLHGVDRTGAMMAVYRMELEGWDNARAYAEMIYFGAHSIWRDLQTFVKKYRPTGRYAARVPAVLPGAHKR